MIHIQACKIEIFKLYLTVEEFLISIIVDKLNLILKCKTSLG